MKNILNQKHKGFAMTLEVLATLFMLTVLVNLTLYNIRVMNVQRYFNTILTSTAAQASRWGGVNTRAYKVNVLAIDLLSDAKSELVKVAPDYSPNITGTPDKIKSNSEKITITIYYRLPSVFSTNSKVSSLSGSQVDMYNGNTKTMSISVHSIMESGNLL